jgi:hypothetical protein
MIMKKLSIIFTALLILTSLLMNSCKSFLDLQENPNSAGSSSIKEPVIFPAVCAQWLQRAHSSMVGPLEWNIQEAIASTSPPGGNLGLMGTNVSGAFFDAYSNILVQAKDLESYAVKNGNTHYQGIAELLQAYGWASVTDFFGKVPYTEAFQFPAIYHPHYDEQSVVYTAIEVLISKAITHLEDTKTQANIGKDDLIYGGDIAKWTKLAYSFKARYAMRLSYAPGKTKTGQADIVLAALAKGLSANTDNALFKHYDATGSRGWVYEDQRGLADGYIATIQNINMMKSTNDPRLPVYFTKDYLGGYSGLQVGVLYAQNQKPSFVSRTTYMLPAMSSVFMTYAECKFLEAEAYVFKGNYVAAKTSFELAVNADMKSLAVAIPQATIDAFLLQFNFASNEETAQKIIINQKYLSNFYETPEMHFDKIRTGYPIYDYAACYHPNLGAIAVPRQLPYAQGEVDYNYNVPPVTGTAQTNRNWWDAKTLSADMH